MTGIRLAGLSILIYAIIIGCSGSYGNLETQSDSESKVTQKKLIDNWSDYNIRYRSAVIIFDPKNDGKKILLGGIWGTVKDQETWTAIIKENTTGEGDFSPVWADYSMTEVREIWGPDKQLYGFIIHQQGDLVSVKLVDKNTLRLWYNRARIGGP